MTTVSLEALKKFLVPEVEGSSKSYFVDPNYELVVDHCHVSYVVVGKGYVNFDNVGSFSLEGDAVTFNSSSLQVFRKELVLKDS